MNPAPKPIMPAFPPVEELEFDETYSMALANLSTLSVKEMGEAGVRFRCVTPAEAATVSKDSLEKKLTDFAVQLYNSKSLTLIEFRKYLDEAARKRLRNR